MGSKTFDGVRFAAYSHDHDPPHGHGYYAGIEAVVELMAEQRGVMIANREDSRRPRNAKRSDVQRILRVAQQNFADLIKLWETSRS